MRLLPLLSRYLARRTIGPLALITAVLCALIWTLQALRLGHHLVSAGVGPAGLGTLALLSLPTLLRFGLPLALAAAILFCCARLDDELLAMHAAGLPPSRLASGPLLVTLVVASATLAAGALERPALASLGGLLRESGARALLGRARPRTFTELDAGTTIYAAGLERPAAGVVRARGVLLALDSPQRLIVARAAELTLDTSEARVLLRVRLQKGEVQLRSHAGRLQRLRFARLDHRVDLTHALAPHFGWLGRLGHDPLQRAGQTASCIVLGALAAFAGTRRRWRTGALAALGFEGARRALALATPAAGLLLSATVLGAVLFGYLRRP